MKQKLAVICYGILSFIALVLAAKLLPRSRRVHVPHHRANDADVVNDADEDIHNVADVTDADVVVECGKESLSQKV